MKPTANSTSLTAYRQRGPLGQHPKRTGFNGGSVRVSLNNIAQPRVIAMTPCIHLPALGMYALNGWGRAGIDTSADRDVTILAWEYRNSGSEACNAGPPTMSGDHMLGVATNWFSPLPSLINVTQAQFTNLSSISIALVVEARISGGGVPNTAFGGFDGITLTLVGDTIFANGFD